MGSEFEALGYGFSEHGELLVGRDFEIRARGHDSENGRNRGMLPGWLG